MVRSQRGEVVDDLDAIAVEPAFDHAVPEKVESGNEPPFPAKQATAAN